MHRDRTGCCTFTCCLNMSYEFPGRSARLGCFTVRIVNYRHFVKRPQLFDVHRAVHHNIMSIVKPTRCTNVSNLFYFGTTLYVFRTVFPSITSSSRLYIQQQSNRCCMYSLELLMMDRKTVRNMYVQQQSNRYCCLLASRYQLASRQQYLFDKCHVAVCTVFNS